MELNIKADAEAIRDAIEKAMTVGPRVLHGSPLMKALGRALDLAQPRVEEWARTLVTSVLEDPNVQLQMQQKLAHAMFAEAEQMGRKAARAAVNSRKLYDDGVPL